jgi:hypothetical protein
MGVPYLLDIPFCNRASATQSLEWSGMKNTCVCPYLGESVVLEWNPVGKGVPKAILAKT